MDYRTFIQYSSTLPSSLIRLDDLNPYPIAALLQLDKSEVKYREAHNVYVRKSEGVRSSLSQLFSYFKEKSYSLCIPEDIYPEYFRIAGTDTQITRYQTFGVKDFTLPRYSNTVLLIADPIIPAGHYLTSEMLASIDQWLTEDDSRWLVVDTVYDYNDAALRYPFRSSNIVTLGSLSKTSLKPKHAGWAICKNKLPDFEYQASMQVPLGASFTLQSIFNTAWSAIWEGKYLRNHCWTAPDVGYLTIIKCNYRSLVEVAGIAAVPGTVFGITDDNLSVISCLSEVKNELLKNRPSVAV